ncbi:MAG: hypothetical protein J5I59_08955 [Saprospiraceae bacterium]|nr:hypothetical protein [Saprospiraceae bacterium]
MTIIKLMTYIGIAALVVTAVTIYRKKSKNYLISYFQHFAGILFLVSGFVKAVDPLGTAFKTEQYFDAFYYTLEGTKMSFLANIFPYLNNYVNAFSIGTIVLEMMLGVMLILGVRPKLTSWAFFLLMLFFTSLTGFTFLTGYVPTDVNFFEFSKWGPFVESNMRVSDCGCFGDFIKIVPKTSFMKDLFLMIPAILFLLYHNKFHKLLTAGARLGITTACLVAFLFFCLNYTYWNEPSIDFRPFKEGVNIREQKQKELEAEANRPVYQIITPKGGGESVTLSSEEYAKRWKEFPKDKFDIVQKTGESEMEHTKISDFRITDEQDQDVTDQILSDTAYSLMIINYKVDFDKEMQEVVTADTTFAPLDSTKLDSIGKPAIVSINKTTEKVEVPVFKPEWIKLYGDKITPLLKKATDNHLNAYVVFGGLTTDQIDSAIKKMGINVPAYQADETILKTVIRSNPGIILWKDGTIIKKWHINKAPSWDEVKEYIK